MDIAEAFSYADDVCRLLYDIRRVGLLAGAAQAIAKATCLRFGHGKTAVPALGVESDWATDVVERVKTILGQLPELVGCRCGRTPDTSASMLDRQRALLCSCPLGKRFGETPLMLCLRLTNYIARLRNTWPARNRSSSLASCQHHIALIPAALYTGSTAGALMMAHHHEGRRRPLMEALRDVRAEHLSLARLVEDGTPELGWGRMAHVFNLAEAMKVRGRGISRITCERFDAAFHEHQASRAVLFEIFLDAMCPHDAHAALPPRARDISPAAHDTILEASRFFDAAFLVSFASV